MRDWMREMFLGSFVTSDVVPVDSLIIFQPGESWDVTKPDGSVQRFEVRPPTGAIIMNIGGVS
jgi:hypothetical protein